jgi:c(7)-type cytochrome triheme protein
MFQGIKSLLSTIRGLVEHNLRLTILLLIVLVAVMTFVSYEALHFTSDPKFCKNCHPAEKPGPLGEVYSWSKSKHAMAGVQCLDCHARPGAVQYLIAKVSALYDVYGEFLKGPEHKMHVLQLSSDPEYAAKMITNQNCLFCHTDAYNEKVRSGNLMRIIIPLRKIDGVTNPKFRQMRGLPDVLTQEVRTETDVDPRHNKHFQNGLNCVDCHIMIAHSGITGYRTNMGICFDCHDVKRQEGKKPPSNEDCMACHRKKDTVIPHDPIVFGSGDKAVRFEHTFHTEIFQCNECHDKTFWKKKKGTVTIRFSDHLSNGYCFSCHNGSKAFAWQQNCAKCHGKAPLPEGPITYKIKDAAPVSFSHDFHTQVFACDSCHTKLWPMKRGAKKMTMDSLYQGKYCGSCHNGKDAFESTECDKCHIEPKKK